MGDGDSAKGTEVRCHASQTSRYNLGVGPRCSITPAFPHERAVRCMNQTNKQINLSGAVPSRCNPIDAVQSMQSSRAVQSMQSRQWNSSMQPISYNLAVAIQPIKYGSYNLLIAISLSLENQVHRTKAPNKGIAQGERTMKIGIRGE